MSVVWCHSGLDEVYARIYRDCPNNEIEPKVRRTRSCPNNEFELYARNWRRCGPMIWWGSSRMPEDIVVVSIMNSSRMPETEAVVVRWFDEVPKRCWKPFLVAEPYARIWNMGLVSNSLWSGPPTELKDVLDFCV